jgi:hypothetical protein
MSPFRLKSSLFVMLIYKTKQLIFFLSASLLMFANCQQATQTSNPASAPSEKQSLSASVQSADLSAGTAQTSPFRVLGIIPNDAAPNIGVRTVRTFILVQFSALVDKAFLTSDTFYVTDGTTKISGTPVASNNNYVIFYPSSPWTEGKTYVVTLTTGIKDVNGNPLDRNYTFNFSTTCPHYYNSRMIPDGPVNAVVQVGCTMYLGGNFTSFSSKATAAVVNNTTGSPISNLNIDGEVLVSIPDSVNGGWYIGGTFNNVNGLPRSKIAHINADGTLSGWQLGTIENQNGPASVRALTLVIDPFAPGYLYIGGQFTSVGGARLLNLAAVFNTTLVPGMPYVGDTDIAASVNSIKYIASGSTTPGMLLIGGKFSSFVNGGHIAFRQNMGAINVLGGTLNLTLDTNGPVNAISNCPAAAPLPGYVGICMGGNFSKISGASHANAAILLVQTNGSNAIPWPFPFDTDGEVKTLMYGGQGLYMGGSFQHVNGVARSNLALVAWTGAVLNNLSAMANAPVNSISVANFLVYDFVYLGGDFTQIANTAVSRAALFIVTSSASGLQPWKPAADGPICALSGNGSSVFIGGKGPGEKILRNHLAALTTDGQLTDWMPNVDGPVLALAAASLGSSGILYVGGTFSKANNIQRQNLAALDVGDGSLLPWQADATGGKVATIATSVDTVYVGGSFLALGGHPRNGLGAVDFTGAVLGWNPGINTATNNQINVIKTLQDGTVIFGGYFQKVGGNLQQNVAAVTSANDSYSVINWNPNPNGAITNMVVGPIFEPGLMGNFTQVGGVACNGFAVVELSTKSTCLKGLYPPLNAYSINAAAMSDAYLIAAGTGTSTTAPNNLRIAFNNPPNGYLSLLNDNASAYVSNFVGSAKAVFAVGNFEQFNGSNYPHIVGLNFDGTTLPYPPN